MLLNTLCSIAFYCQRCGQIHIQDVPFFSGQDGLVVRCGNCSHEQAVLRVHPRKGLTIETVCGVCNRLNTLTYGLKKVRRLTFEKIYCRHDSFELGYIGEWQAIAEFLDFNAAEYEALHPGDEDNFMVRQQIFLEAMNRVHELVECRSLVCPCGSQNFVADIVDDLIILECTDCGSYLEIPAGSAADLRRLVPGFRADFILPDARRKN
ncbi:MAG: hypothetical protein IJ849_11535 [Selenomonadaceae bacterium]|nr:hypothetical protein [Selenomonadaceae bacterium]